MVPRFVVALSVLFALVSPAFGQAPDPAEMRTYYLVFVVPDPEFEEESWIADNLANHRNARLKTAGELYLESLVNGKVAVVAGALPENEAILGVAVMNVDTSADAASLFDHDPGVQSGRRKIEVYPWWVPDGILKQPKKKWKKPLEFRFAHLAFWKRPADVSEYTTEQLEEIERGHVQHLLEMTQSGDLVVAGPVENGGDLKGVGIFRTRNTELVRELAGKDPAIEAGTLELELHRWRVPKRAWIHRGEQEIDEEEASPDGEAE